MLGIDRQDANYESNYRTISKFLVKLGLNGALDLINEVKSQIRQGEWATVNNPPAMFIRRIKSRLGLAV